MEKRFCGAAFWNESQSWDTENPLLDTCFRDVVLRLVPCAILFLLSPFEYFAKSKPRQVQWGPVNVTRVVFAIIACVAQLIEFVNLIVTNDFGKHADVVSYTPFLVTVSFLWTAYLLLRAKKRGFVRSGIVWLFVSISTVFSAFNCYFLMDDRIKLIGLEYYTAIMSLPVFFILLILCSIADKPVIQKEDKVSPRELASFPSSLTFWWVTGLAYNGWRRMLDHEDMHALVDVNKTKHLGPMLRKNLMRPGVDGMDVSGGVTKALFKTFGGQLFYSAIFKCAMDWSDFITPLLLRRLLSFAMDEDEPDWHGYVIATAMLMSTFSYNITQNAYYDLTAVLGIRIRTALMTCIYKKALTISNSARRERTAGEIVNLMSVDADRFRPLLEYLNISWAAFFQISIAIYLLYRELGYSAFAGVLVLILLMPFNAWVSTLMETSQKKQMDRKDERVKSMNEILSGMRVIKMYAWEEAFTQIIHRMRASEVKFIRRIAYFNSLLGFMWTITPVLVSFFTFAVYVLSDSSHVLTPVKVFFCLSVFNIMRQPLNNLPFLLSHMVATYVALKRLNSFFSAPDLRQYLTCRDDGKDVVAFENARLSWNGAADKASQSDFQLRLNMQVPEGSLIAIVGVVGSGKSSLISAMLGEMQLLEGRVNISSRVHRVAYVPQQAWIQNQTLKNNILFGKEYNKVDYEEVVKRCELTADLAILSAGDETEIGEKGINLSGGQKQRVSLARACYSDADLFLLDDPLSAVDSHVAKKLFQNLFSSKTGLLRLKTRILVTNSLSILPEVDKIVVLKNGSISESGSYSELVSRGGAFSEFLEEFSITIQSDGDNITKPEPVIPSERKRTGSFAGSQTLTDCITMLDESRPKEEKIKKDVLIEEEKRELGRVKLSVFVNYFKHMSKLYIVVAAFLLSEACDAGGNYWLSQWSEDDPFDGSSSGNSTSTGGTNSAQTKRLMIYSLLGISNATFMLIGLLGLAKGAVDAAIKLHNSLLHRVFRSPLSFFDTTPIGRIINRFSKDMDSIDIWLVDGLSFMLISFLQVAASIIMIMAAIPIFAVVVIPLALFFFVVQRFYVATSRQLRRLDSTTRSPIYSLFSETLSGVSTIRSYGVTERFIQESDELIDKNQACTLCSAVSNRWLSVRLQFVGNMCVFFCAIFAVIVKDSLDPGLTGIAVMYAMQMSSLLNWFVQVVSAVETDAVSIERVMEYSNIEQEADWLSPDQHKPAGNWPSEGAIDFVDYATRYREGLDLVIRGITAHIAAKEKIGIVGRTGAGKSSITLSLFRIIEPASGKIFIDGIDASQIGLHDLRSKLTIIPQDPVLFSGTLRTNLDPFDEKSDEQLWSCLEMAHLRDFIKGLDNQLDYKVSEGGENLSVGQRQLVCLARALLRKTKILVLDEATAAVDLETDSLIQSTIRSQFADCTILTIAHRLHTILDSDRVLVMDRGMIAEFDTPNALLQNHKSIFYSLAKDAGLVT